ncbi:MAG: cob(I)yrinic acid a,c-diamide adenosyltransferase [bacterium]|nr:cob(I)yrinic acid a,c-diamide adenosyltransferase [bacterium]
MGEERIGTVQVYTGDGKGKTTASLGLGLRAWGHGHRVLYIQFMKGRINYGELEAAKKMDGFDIIQMGRETFVSKENPDPVDVEMAQDGFKLLQEKVALGEYDMIVADELNVALDFGLVELGPVVELIKGKPSELELVITGRNAHPDIIELADLVSEVREIKHHYKNDVEAREGVEY